jgi:antitoxin (DNA-binding transcriptional repressor) of toxin-antitoxin stability system
MKRKAKDNTTAPTPIADAPEYVRPARQTFRVTEYEHTALQVGYVIMYAGREHVVASVNTSCARIVPITEGAPKQVSFTPKLSDKPVSFIAPERNSAVSNSANSESPVLRKLGSDWRARV